MCCVEKCREVAAPSRLTAIPSASASKSGFPLVEGVGVEVLGTGVGAAFTVGGAGIAAAAAAGSAALAGSTFAVGRRAATAFGLGGCCWSAQVTCLRMLAGLGLGIASCSSWPSVIATSFGHGAAAIADAVTGAAVGTGVVSSGGAVCTGLVSSGGAVCTGVVSSVGAVCTGVVSSVGAVCTGVGFC